MSAKYSDFFDIPSKNQESAEVESSSDQSFFDIPSKKDSWVKPPAPPVSEQLSHFPEMLAREGAATFYSLPSSTAETYRFLGGKLQQLGEEQAAAEGREISPMEKKLTNLFVNYLPDLVKDLGEKFPNALPTFQKAQEKIGSMIEKHTGKQLPKEGRGFIERAASGIGKAIPVTLSPGSPIMKGAAIGTSALTEGLDLSEKSKLIGNLSIPAMVSIIEAIARKKYTPPKGEAALLYKEAKALGFTDEQLAPIMATEGQIERHGPLATGVRKTREAFEETGQVLGNAIEDMQNRPQNFTALAPAVENELLNSLQNIENDLRRRTHALSPKELALADFVKQTINDIHTNGSTPRQLIGTWRSVNKVGGGKSELNRIKEPLLKAIKSADPNLANELQTTNQLYAKYINNLKEINPTQFNAFVDSGELQQILTAVFSGNTNTISQSLLRFVGLNGLRKISSNILINPTAQSLVRNFGKAVRDGHKASARAVGIQLQEYVKKNLPEDYDSIDWEKLGLKD